MAAFPDLFDKRMYSIPRFLSSIRVAHQSLDLLQQRVDALRRSLRPKPIGSAEQVDPLLGSAAERHDPIEPLAAIIARHEQIDQRSHDRNRAEKQVPQPVDQQLALEYHDITEHAESRLAHSVVLSVWRRRSAAANRRHPTPRHRSGTCACPPCNGRRSLRWPAPAGPTDVPNPWATVGEPRRGT